MSSGERKRIEAKPVACETRQGLWGRGRGIFRDGAAAPSGSHKVCVLGEGLWKGSPERVRAPYPKTPCLLVYLFPSSTEPVKFGVNPAGPPAKPEYFLVTDSGRVP